MKKKILHVKMYDQNSGDLFIPAVGEKVSFIGQIYAH